MELIRKYKAILLVVIPIVILVIFRATGTNHFGPDAKKLAEASFSGLNIIIPDKVNQLNGDKLLINLGKDVIKHNFEGAIVKVISPDSILAKENIRMMKKHEGPIVLYSSENSISVRLWMLLSQMGIKDLYVLSENSDPEVLKYEFRPDTLVRPEL